MSKLIIPPQPTYKTFEEAMENFLELPESLKKRKLTRKEWLQLAAEVSKNMPYEISQLRL
jgi:hypothetical protein